MSFLATFYFLFVFKEEKQLLEFGFEGRGGVLRFDFSKGFDFGGNFQIAVFGYQESVKLLCLVTKKVQEKKRK